MTASAPRRPRLSGPRIASAKAADFWTSLRTDLIDLIAELRNLGCDTEITPPALPVGELLAATTSAEIDTMLDDVRALRTAVREARRLARESARAGQAADSAAAQLVADRLYERDGEIYRTVLSGRGTLYAKIWTTDGWEYDASYVRLLRPEHRMTVDRAIALSLRLGRCVRCGALLTAEESVERGIGPVCITKI